MEAISHLAGPLWSASAALALSSVRGCRIGFAVSFRLLPSLREFSSESGGGNKGKPETREARRMLKFLQRKKDEALKKEGPKSASRPHSASAESRKRAVERKVASFQRDVWKLVKRRKHKEVDRQMRKAHEEGLPADELTLTMRLHHILLDKPFEGQAGRAKQVLDTMKEMEVHPAIVRLNERLLSTWIELDSMDARPREEDWRKMFRYAWYCSSVIRLRRLRAVERRRQAMKDMGYNKDALPDVHDTRSLWFSPVDPLLHPDEQSEMLGLPPASMQREDIYSLPEALALGGVSREGHEESRVSRQWTETEASARLLEIQEFSRQRREREAKRREWREKVSRMNLERRDRTEAETGEKGGRGGGMTQVAPVFEINGRRVPGGQKIAFKRGRFQIRGGIPKVNRPSPEG
uniref:Uncharacterized protein n=1 Tax=Chromera velia CCMP2878 TaxID=1169474 RepID=A0A0G4IEI3_9ALVE|eukprot:Cvel_13620.t1-p1 / transcript=Cvel_13620.t1 / gene=Cvel_13620 / organism=Chromera_velia_CCMP2878 / gene_product=hypothetical protein / transcript_product=hypothetical protein / location=Cvel_scaffold938:13018-14238(-) / protein_length=407 / sequence_SO=supercontig / SO=protein_coding / is_pseudo=false